MKILLNYTLTNYPNEPETNISTIKPNLLPSNSKNSNSIQSFNEINSFDNTNIGNGNLNTKYPVPLEPISRSRSNSHHSFDNASYIDSPYVPESPVHNTYKTKGEDILKTRKLCVSINNNNNIMDIIDGQPSNLSVSPLNQKQRKRNHYIQNRPKLAPLPKSYHNLLF